MLGSHSGERPQGTNRVRESSEIVMTLCDILLERAEIDTEYDRAKVPPYNGNDPCPPLVV